MCIYRNNIALVLYNALTEKKIIKFYKPSTDFKHSVKFAYSFVQKIFLINSYIDKSVSLSLTLKLFIITKRDFNTLMLALCM